MPGIALASSSISGKSYRIQAAYIIFGLPRSVQRRSLASRSTLWARSGDGAHVHGLIGPP